MTVSETIVEAAGYPALVRLRGGEAHLPLVAFVTGGGVLARIAYGHAEGDPPDFLFHWLEQAGFATIGLSYPIANPAFDGAFPRFGIRDWAAQCAELIVGAVGRFGLPRRVIVLAWSMAGRLAEPLNAALQARGAGIELFVAMCGATPLPNLMPGLAAIMPSTAGLGQVGGGFQAWLERSLAERNAAEGHEIIAPALFAARFLGDFPIRLAGSAMRYQAGAFRHDPAGDAEQTGAANYAGFPPLALMTHDSALDARHALSDRAAWGFYITQSLTEALLRPPGADMTAVPPERWRRALELIHAAPARLTAVLPGNHMFFLGTQGAQETVASLAALRREAAALASELEACRG